MRDDPKSGKCNVSRKKTGCKPLRRSEIDGFAVWVSHRKKAKLQTRKSEVWKVQEGFCSKAGWEGKAVSKGGWYKRGCGPEGAGKVGRWEGGGHGDH